MKLLLVDWIALEDVHADQPHPLAAAERAAVAHEVPGHRKQDVLRVEFRRIVA